MNNHSTIQEIPRLLLNSKAHYYFHKSLALVPILSHMHSVHNFSPSFPKIHSNIILSSTLRPSKWFLPFRFSDQNILCRSHLSSICYMLLPFHVPLFDHNYNVQWRVQIMKLLIM